jgi:uncharacterized OB-fold protein
MANEAYSKPLPRPNRVSQPFWDGCKRHELLLQKCAACGHVWFPPSSRCPECLSTEYSWMQASGRGRVWSWIVMWQRYFAAFEGEIPYNVAYVTLDEGPRMMTNLVGIENDAIECDMPVVVVFEDVTSEISLPKFGPLRITMRPAPRITVRRRRSQT